MVGAGGFMAAPKKKITAKGGKDEANVAREPYLRIPIDRSVAAESSRRNVSVIVWYKRLIDATLGLLIASAVFVFISIFFAWTQPAPELYGTASDGGLRAIDYVRSGSDPRLGKMRQDLAAEESSRAILADRREGVAGLPKTTAIAPPQAPAAPAPADSSVK
jgi:hypothetical protein